MWSAPPTACPRCRGGTLDRSAVQGPYGRLPPAAFRTAGAARKVPRASPVFQEEAALRRPVRDAAAAAASAYREPVTASRARDAVTEPPTGLLYFCIGLMQYSTIPVAASGTAPPRCPDRIFAAGPPSRAGSRRKFRAGAGTEIVPNVSPSPGRPRQGHAGSGLFPVLKRMAGHLCLLCSGAYTRSGRQIPTNYLYGGT